MLPHLNRIATLSVSLALLAGTAAAQGDHRLGLMAGVNFGTVGGKGTETVDDVKYRTGFLAGGFGELSLHRNVSLQAEVYYSQKGAKVVDAGTDAIFKIGYVEIPVFFKAVFPMENSGKVKVRPHLYAGPAVGFRLSCKIKGEDNNVTVEVNCDEDPFDVQLKKTDFSVIFGGGVDIGPFFVGARYDLGLTDLNDDPLATSDDALKTRTISVLAGVSFPLRRR